MNINVIWENVVVVDFTNSPALNSRLDHLCAESKVHLFTDSDPEFFNSQYQNIRISTLNHFSLALLNEPDNTSSIIDAVFVFAEKEDFKNEIYQFCKANRIPLNIHNTPHLSTFTVPASYINGPLHVSISTSLKGCKIASRIKREIIKSLPPNIDEIITNVGQLRETIKADNQSDSKQKLKWLAQIIEYYPLSQLHNLSIDDLSQTLSTNQIDINSNKGSISLVGSGPGSLSHLTLGAINAIYSADLVLADKLVPQEILNLIPQSTKVFIARKFPGNADRAQQELLDMGLEALKLGQNVVRLKQGDPYIFGRGGEEWLFFNSHGYKVNVLPGLSSAFVATATAGIPTTHRGVADQVMICTGVGRAGAIPDNLPTYEAKRTTIFLMSIKRIVDILSVLKSKGWPDELPVSIVERASCGDERVIKTTLGSLAEVCKQVDSRPPGLIVTGWVCDVYEKLPEGQRYQIKESGLAEDTDLTKIVGYLTAET